MATIRISDNEMPQSANFFDLDNRVTNTPPAASSQPIALRD